MHWTLMYPGCLKQMLLDSKEQTVPYTITLSDFNARLSTIVIQTNVRNGSSEWNYISDQMNFTNINGMFCPTAVEYTFI